MGLKSQIWSNLLVGKDNEFLHNSSWFLKLGMNMDKFVENEAINFTHKGTIPGVTKNPTYPLTQINRADIPDSIPLAPYASDEFILPKIDLHGLPYEKRASVLVDHRAAITDSLASEGIWNVSPFENTANTPLIDATGSVVNSYKLITGTDIINLRKALNKQFPGLKMAPWVLVLDTDSYWGLAASDEILKGQMIQKASIGNVNLQGINYHGFELYEDDRTPYYDAATSERMTYGASPVIGTDFRSATAFVANKTFAKAVGKVELFDNPKDSSFQADRGSFLVHGYVGPLSLDLETNLTFMGGILRKP